MHQQPLAGTRLRYVARSTFHGPARLAQPIVKGSLDKLGDDTIDQLTRTLAPHD